MWWRGVLFMLAIGLLAALAGDPPPETIVAPNERPVRIATMPCSPTLQTTSSGFVIDDGLVVTVAHAIYESREFAVQDWTGEWHQATVQHMDLERDLALLSIRALRAGRMETADASSGDGVRMLDGAASGEVAGEILRRVRIDTEVIGDLSQTSKRSGYELSVDIGAGDSGAALLNDDDHLVGIIFARSTRRDASWATSVAEIQTVRDRTDVPTWECETPSDAQLVLPPLEPRLP